MSKWLNVLMGGIPIARLEQMDTGVLALEYNDRWLAADRIQIPLSLSLAARRKEAYRGGCRQLSLESAS
jgi:serine/threonine-protein kinase HipA